MKRFLITVVILLFSAVSVQAGSLPKYSELYKFLIDLRGWKAEQPTGSNMSSPMGEMVTAERTYHKGSKELHAQILGGFSAMAAWVPFGMGMTYDSPDEFFKTFSLEGFPAGVSHQKGDNSGTVVVQIKGVTNTQGVVFVLNYNKMSYEEAIDIVKKFPLKEIKKVFR
jgi:hypothetical protein